MTDPGQPRTDPLVDRVNELTTTFLDMLGALLLAAGAAYGVWALFGLGWALPTGGLALILLSSVAQLRSRPRGSRSSAPAELVEVPGPSHPGTMHMAGGR